MNKFKKVIVALIVIVFIVTLLPESTSAAKVTPKVTDAQLKKIMKCYCNILATNPYKSEGGFTADTFLIKDLNKDGVPELIINSEVPQIFTYNLDSNKEDFIYNSWTYCTLYYSSETMTILYYYTWKGEEEWSFYKMEKGNKEDDLSFNMNSFEDYSYTDRADERYDKGYYKGSFYSKDAKKITKKEVTAAIKKLAPKKVELKTTIQNTEKNRNKYLKSIKEFKKLYQTIKK
jgi:hypothetical protein